MSEAPTEDMSAILADLPPVSDGEFAIGEELGRGSFGTTYFATYQTTASDVRQCVIKILHPKVASDINHVRRFIREAKSLIRLKGAPHVVGFKGLKAHSDGSLWLVMDHVPGENLARRLKRSAGLLPLEEALRFGVQIARGIAAVHSRHLIHRDIKPSNIMVTSVPNQQATLTLVDFGLVYDEMGTKSSFVSGTYGYMPPEQAFADKRAGSSVDLYALGVTIYEMLTGTLPFAGMDPRKWISAIPPDVSAACDAVRFAPGLSEIVSNLIQPEPVLRTRSARKVAIQLGTAVKKLEDYLAISFHRTEESINKDDFESARSFLALAASLTTSGELARLRALLKDRERSFKRRRSAQQLAVAIDDENYMEVARLTEELENSLNHSRSEVTALVRDALMQRFSNIREHWGDEMMALLTRTHRGLRRFRPELGELERWQLYSLAFRCFQKRRFNRVEKLVTRWSNRSQDVTIPLIAARILGNAASMSQHFPATEVVAYLKTCVAHDISIAGLIEPVQTNLRIHIDEVVEAALRSECVGAAAEMPNLLARTWKLVGRDKRLEELLDNSFARTVADDQSAAIRRLRGSDIATVIRDLNHRLLLRRLQFSSLPGYKAKATAEELGARILSLYMETPWSVDRPTIEALLSTGHDSLANLAKACIDAASGRQDKGDSRASKRSGGAARQSAVPSLLQIIHDPRPERSWENRAISAIQNLAASPWVSEEDRLDELLRAAAKGAISPKSPFLEFIPDIRLDRRPWGTRARETLRSLFDLHWTKDPLEWGKLLRYLRKG